MTIIVILLKIKKNSKKENVKIFGGQAFQNLFLLEHAVVPLNLFNKNKFLFPNFFNFLSNFPSPCVPQQGYIQSRQWGGTFSSAPPPFPHTHTLLEFFEKCSPHLGFWGAPLFFVKKNIPLSRMCIYDFSSVWGQPKI